MTNYQTLWKTHTRPEPTIFNVELACKEAGITFRVDEYKRLIGTLDDENYTFQYLSQLVRERCLLANFKRDGLNTTIKVFLSGKRQKLIKEGF